MEVNTFWKKCIINFVCLKSCLNKKNRLENMKVFFQQLSVFLCKGFWKMQKIQIKYLYISITCDIL